MTTKWCRMYSFENSTFPQLFSSTIFIIFLLIKKKYEWFMLVIKSSFTANSLKQIETEIF